MSNNLREELRDYISSLTDKLLDRMDLQIKIQEKFGDDDVDLIELMSMDVVEIHRDLTKIVDKYDEDEDEDEDEDDDQYDYNANKDFRDKKFSGLIYCGKCGKLDTKSI